MKILTYGHCRRRTVLQRLDCEDARWRSRDAEGVEELRDHNRGSQVGGEDQADVGKHLARLREGRRRRGLCHRRLLATGGSAHVEISRVPRRAKGRFHGAGILHPQAIRIRRRESGHDIGTPYGSTLPARWPRTRTNHRRLHSRSYATYRQNNANPTYKARSSMDSLLAWNEWASARRNSSRMVIRRYRNRIGFRTRIGWASRIPLQSPNIVRRVIGRALIHRKDPGGDPILLYVAVNFLWTSYITPDCTSWIS